MKKALFITFLVSSSMIFAQAPGFGIKGGLNYGSVRDIEFTSEFATETFSAENNTGYHAGIFYKIDLAGLFIQPELMYTKLNTEYSSQNILADTNPLNYELSKIDLPVLLGIKLLGPLNVKAGPSFQYILNSLLEDVDAELDDPEETITIGYQLGVGLTLGHLGIDLRYEGAITENNIVAMEDIENTGIVIDSRPSQFILSLSYSFGRQR